MFWGEPVGYTFAFIVKRLSQYTEAGDGVISTCSGSIFLTVIVTEETLFLKFDFAVIFAVPALTPVTYPDGETETTPEGDAEYEI